MTNIKAAIPTISTTLSTDSVTQLCNFGGPAGHLPQFWQTRLRLIGGLRPSHLGPSFGAALSVMLHRMARDLITLGDAAKRGAEMIEIRCGRCERTGRLHVARLLEAHGPGAAMGSVLHAPWWGTARDARARKSRRAAIPTCSDPRSSELGREIIARSSPD